MRKELGAELRTDPMTGEQVVDLGGGVMIPAIGAVVIGATEESPYETAIHYRWWKGRFEPTEVAVRGQGGQPVTGEVLRKVPVERMLRNRLVASIPLNVDRPGRRSWRGLAEEVLADELALVAACYRLGYATRQPPVQAVAEFLGVPVSTAGKRVMAAREAGLLPPTIRGKAGA